MTAQNPPPPPRPTRRRATRRHAGFIFVYGWRTITTRDRRPPVVAPCPACGVPDARLVGRLRRPWFTLMFVPLFPIQRAANAQRLSQCRECRHTFDLPLDQLARRAGALATTKLSDTFAVYNDLREHPTDGTRLLRLLQMYEAANEPGEAETAVRHFPQAVAAEPACAAVLRRMRAAAVG